MGKQKPIDLSAFDEVVKEIDLSAFDEIVKKKTIPPVFKSGLPPLNSGSSPFQDTKPVAPTVLSGGKQKEFTEKNKGYVQPKEKPKTLTEAVQDDDSYIGALWNQIPNALSDFVGGASKLVGKAIIGHPLAQMTKGVFEGVKQAGDFNAPNPITPLLTTDKAEQFGKFGEEMVGKLRTSASSQKNEEEIQQGFDLSDGLGWKDAKAVPLMLTRMLADVGLAMPTGGLSFAAQGYNQGLKEYDTAVKDIPKEFQSNTSREFFAVGYGTINGLADKLGLDFITKSPVVSKAVKRFILKGAVQALAKAEGKITSEVIEKTIAGIAKQTFSKIKTVGVKVAIGTGGEALTETVQGGLSDGLKILTEKLSDNHVFDVAQVKQDFWKSRINDMAGALAMGGTLSGAMHGLKSSDSYIAERVAESTTPEQITALKEELTNSVNEQGEPLLDEEKLTVLNQAIDKYSQANQKLPKGLSTEKRAKALQLISERDEAKSKVESAVKETESLDEAIQPDKKPDVDVFKNKEQQKNDEIRETVAGKTYKYTKDEKGNFFKQLGNGEPEKITEEYYNLQNQEKELPKEAKVEEKVAEEPVVAENVDANPRESAENPPVQETEVFTKPEQAPKSEQEVVNNQGEDVQSDVQTNPEAPKSVAELYPNPLERAEYDIDQLKKTDNKLKKYEASVKRLLEAKKTGVITEQEFNDTKSRLDDVLAEADLKAPKIELPKENEALLSDEQGNIIEQEPVQEKAPVVSKKVKLPILNEVESARKMELRKKFARFNDITNIIATVADKEFREYAGLVLKEAKGEFSVWSKEMIADMGEAIKEHLPKLFKELNGDKSEPVKEAKSLKEDAGSFESLAQAIPDNGELKDYLSGETISKYEGEDARNDQSYEAKGLMLSAEHGQKVIESAKAKFGEEYVAGILSHLEGAGSTVDAKALIYVSLENDLAKRKLSEPENELSIAKLQDLVRAKSQAYLRANSIAINMGRLRKLAEVGYDLQSTTDQFFSTTQKRAKHKVEKALQADADAINKEAESREVENSISHDVEQAIAQGVEKQISEIYESLPSNRRKSADKAIAALDKIQKKLRSYTYDASIGIPVAIIDAGITTIKGAIRAGVNVADAIELGIKKIKEKSGRAKWEKEAKFRQDMLDGFAEENIDTKEGKTRAKGEPQTNEQRLATAKKNLKESIELIDQEIAEKKRILKLSNAPLEGDAELTQLQAEKAAKIKLRDSEDFGKAFISEKAKETVAKRLLSEVEKLDEQIKAGEKAEREAKKDPYESEKINKLKGEKKARLAILEEIDPTPKQFIKEALIEAGFGREIMVTTKGGKEKRQTIDWKKLAGEEGSVDKLKAHVAKALEGKGFTPAQIIKFQESFNQEIAELRESIVKKALAELNDLNTKKPPVEYRSSAKRLAELYNLGLFEKESDTYDYLMNKALGMSELSQESFFKAKELAKVLSDLYKQKDGDHQISEFGLSHAITDVNKKIESLLAGIAWHEGHGFYKAALIAREIFGMSQRALLQSMKQALENPLSGYFERGFSKLTFGLEKNDTPELRKQRAGLARNMFSDSFSNGGMDYGSLNNPFLSKSHTEDWLNNLSKNKTYHRILSTALGKAYLEGMDGMHKVALTEGYFTRNLIKVLTDKSNPKGAMSHEDAVNYVSEQLTGQKFDEAKTLAKQVIDNINTKAGRQVLNTSPEYVNRLAQGIVKDALVKGQKLTLPQIEASFKAGYNTAGHGLGHEQNNIISLGVGLLNHAVEARIKEAVKDKDWNKAAWYTISSVMTKNIINPFVGGGMNWVTLTLQKSGLPLGVAEALVNKGKPMDLSTDQGIRDMEKALAGSARAKGALGRVFIGAGLSFLMVAALKSSGKEDELDKWLKDNPVAAKYLKIVSPQAIIATLAMQSEEMGKYFEHLFNMKVDAYDDMVNVSKGVAGVTSSNPVKKAEGWGRLAAVFGGHLSFPVLPYKMGKDLNDITNTLKGHALNKTDYNVSGIGNGFFRTGMAEFIGLRPDPTYKRKLTTVIPRTDVKILKFLEDKELINSSGSTNIISNSGKEVLQKGGKGYLTAQQAEIYDKTWNETFYKEFKDNFADISAMDKETLSETVSLLKKNATRKAQAKAGVQDAKLAELTNDGSKKVLSGEQISTRQALIDKYLMRHRREVQIDTKHNIRKKGMSEVQARLSAEESLLRKANAEAVKKLTKKGKYDLQAKVDEEE